MEHVTIIIVDRKFTHSVFEIFDAVTDVGFVLQLFPHALDIFIKFTARKSESFGT